MYLNERTKVHEKVAVLNVVHYTYIPSKFLVIFSKITIFKKDILKICQQSAVNMPTLLYAEIFSSYEI